MRSGRIRTSTPYNDSGEHLEDDDDDEDETTLIDPDETGIDLLEETPLDAAAAAGEGGDDMEVDVSHSNNNSKPRSYSTPPKGSSAAASAQPSKSKNISEEEKIRRMREVWGSDDDDDDDDDFEAMLERLKAEKAAKKKKNQQQNQQQQKQHHRTLNSNEEQSIDASHDTEVIANTSSTLPLRPPSLALPKHNKQRDSVGYSFDATQQWERELRDVESLEKNASPTPLPNKHQHHNNNRRMSTNIDTSFLESSQWQLPSQIPTQLTQSSEWRHQSQRKTNNSNTPTGGTTTTTKHQQHKKETWQEEAFRSSLVDLLKTVPYGYFTASREDDNNNNSSSNNNNNNNNNNNKTMGDDFWLGTSSSENNYESQSSVTSQQVASAQLQRQRYLDAASRSLARLAIASRHNIGKSKNYSSNNGGHSNDNDDMMMMGMEESPEFNPPTPRTLPSFMSVLNVIDVAETTTGSSWGRNNDVNATMLKNMSKEIFCGHSVHGRNARTVSLSNESIDCSGINNNRSSNLFESWSLEQLAIGAMKVAAQVCYEASTDSNNNFDRTGVVEENEIPSCRVAGFVAQENSHHSTNKQHEEKKKEHSVSVALIESSLEFLATAFACLESDLVFAVLRLPLQSNDTLIVRVFDSITFFAPSVGMDKKNKKSPSHSASNIPMLALLTLSRGLDAAQFVTRYSTSLDPSSICSSYTSPHLLGEEAYIGQKQNINFGVDEGGVGYLSAVGRDLGLSIESEEGRNRLKACAEYAYDYILDFDPAITDDDSDSLYNSSGHSIGNSRKADNFRLGLKVDTQVGRGMASAYRRPCVVKDRIFSSVVEYLTCLIHFGIVSAWLSPTTGSIDGENADARTVDKLCQKLSSVIEMRARMRRSINQSTRNECDNEAVIASALTLLILCLPRHVEQPTRPSSLSTSFRNMGDESSGTISDLLQSSMVKKIVDLALSWEDIAAQKSRNFTKYHATNNAILILSTFVMAGASEIIQTYASKQMETLVQRVTECVCNCNEIVEGDEDDPSVASALLLLFHLHTDCPLLVRQFLRGQIGSNDDASVGASFVGGLIRLCSSVSAPFIIFTVQLMDLILMFLALSQKYFAVNSIASSLLRALIEGSPDDRTEDVLSELLLKSFNTELVFEAMDDALFTITEILSSAIEAEDNLPGLECNRWLPSLCAFSDMMDSGSHSINFYRCIQVLCDTDDSSDVIDLFARLLNPDRENDHIQNDTLMASTCMSLLMLFVRFVSMSIPFQNDENRLPFQALQNKMSDKLLGPNEFTIVEASRLQGSSVDVMHRALKLQNLMLSFHGDERHMAHSFTRLTSLAKRREDETRVKLSKAEHELMLISSRCRQKEMDCDSLANSIHEQRALYERKIDLVMAEVQMKVRNASQVHAQERKLADERALQYKSHLLAEQESRASVERENERILNANEKLKSELSRDKLRVQELEEMLSEERKSKQLSESELEKRTNELSLVSEELQQTSISAQELQSRLATTEESVSHLTAVCEDSELKLEDTCEKLIKLAHIHQSKEVGMKKRYAQVYSDLKKATRDAETANKQFQKEKHRSDSLTRELDAVKKELDEVKTNKAQMQRMRTQNPVSYINQMHDDNRMKKPSRRSRRGKENSFDGE